MWTQDNPAGLLALGGECHIRMSYQNVISEKEMECICKGDAIMRMKPILKLIAGLQDGMEECRPKLFLIHRALGVGGVEI
jgi:hypothetical protein